MLKDKGNADVMSRYVEVSREIHNWMQNEWIQQGVLAWI